MKLKMIISFLLITFTFSLQAQNARVIEVQDKIKSDVSDFIEKFAPDTKYSVKVKVKPLRRKLNSDNNDDLPFMELEDDLMLDEWDDPQVSVFSLYSRISEANISVYVEERVKIQDRQKFKDALLSDVNLVPGRDRVEIESISSPVMEREFNWKEQVEVLLLGVMLIIAVILGVGLNSLANKMIPSTNADKNSQGDLAQQPASSPAVSGFNPVTPAPSIGGGVSGDLNIQDPSKINEVVSKKITKLMKSKVFPTLKDMVILEELLNSDVASFSYLVYEFPVEVQKIIYQYGKGDKWFKGFSEVGFPSKIVIISLDKMLRDRNIIHSEEFESLLIATWRLDKNLESFIKSIDKDYAFSILYYMPKDLSIPASRECFPGAWGSLLEDNPNSFINDDSLIQELTKKALLLEPYFNYDSLQVFKNRKDLLSYLDKADPVEEREIYYIIGIDSDLSFVRPPFYKFFELDDKDRAKAYRAFSINDWAISVFDTQRDLKDKITSLMDEKEKYLFSQALKSLDNISLDVLNRIEVRKKIAKYVFDNFSNTKLDDSNGDSLRDLDGEQEDAAA